MLALVREVSPQLAHCELSYLARDPIDAARAVSQHRAYTDTLQQLGCRLEWLPPLPEHADGVFVEDTAVVLPEVAVITRPGIASRRGETASTTTALARHRSLARIGEPGCLEGGDVMRIGRVLYVGGSARTNAAGIAGLGALLEPFGYRVQTLTLRGCLHLKSAVTFIPPRTVLVNPQWIDADALAAPQVIAVDEREPYGANTLTVGDTTLVSAAYPRTRQRLEAAGIHTRELDVSELHKAEAALTCMSVMLD
jgi:dimethylargininase